MRPSAQPLASDHSPEVADDAPWIAAPETVAECLGSDLANGLTSEEAANRLARDGPNELQHSEGPGALALFLSEFKSVVIWVLVGAALLSLALREVLDAAAIGAIVLLNALLGFFQEYQAAQAVAALRKMTAPRAKVLRDGKPTVLPAREVVRGDVLLLDAGDLVAADARVFEAAALRTNEASLTGESEPVDKTTLPAPSLDTVLADRTDMVFLGTTVANGQGRALVTATGMSTEIGRIAGLLRSAADEQTPLQRRLDRVGQTLLLACLGVVVLVFLLGLLRGQPVGEMLLGAVSLAVAAIPEGLPAVVTVALAMGVARMVRRNVLIRHLPSVETLGCAQVICSDKTGTLTVGEMTVRTLWLNGREIHVSGEGYAPVGKLDEGGEPVSPLSDPALDWLLRAGVFCNDAELVERDGRWTILGDPTEAALVVAAAKAGIDKTHLHQTEPRRLLLPFDSDRKRMTVVCERDSGSRAYVKGAPEVLLPLCDFGVSPEGAELRIEADERSAILEANERLASRGLRVLALAYRDVADGSTRADDLEQRLVFLGLAAMADPPRAEALKAVRAARAAGIRPVMITGDHPSTGAAIARELEILGPADRVLTGHEVERLSEQELSEQVESTAVYARVTAEDKLRIVRALKSRGLTVAMTGDGVNDAPALREASIGVAMGITGTEVAKEAADMVVTDDNFASIVAAVEEGRGVYDNIRKCLRYLLAGNTAEILVMLVAALAGSPMPLLPLQLLWINLVTDGFPALALAADPVDPRVLQRPPQRPDQQMADRPFLISVARTGVLTAIVSLAAFYYGYRVLGDLEAGRNYAFTTLVYSELLRSFGERSDTLPVWRLGVRVNWYLAWVVVGSIAFQLGIHHFPPLQRLFSIHPISLLECVTLFFLGGVPLTVLELLKTVRLRRAQAGRISAWLT